MKRTIVLIVLGLLLALATACGGGGAGGDAVAPTAAEPAADTDGADDTAADDTTDDTAADDTTDDTAAEPDEEATEILQSALRAMASLTDYSATIDMSFAGAESGDVTMDVVVSGSFLTAGEERPQFKGVVRESTLPSLAEGTVVIFGDQYYVYDPTQDVVLTGAGDSRVFSDLYNLFLGSQTRVVTLISSGVATPRLAGEEMVGDFETMRIDIEPIEDVTDRVLAPGAEGTVWIDTETSLPVQLEYAEEGFETSWTITDLSLDPVDPAAFEPGADIPEGAEQVVADDFGETVTVASVEEAIEAAGFTPLVPTELPADLPGEPTSVGVQETPLGSLIVLGYATASPAESDTDFPLEAATELQTGQSISVRALESETGLPRNFTGAVSDVTVRGQEGVIDVLDDRATLYWVEDGVLYTITSNGFNEDEVIAVAESMEAPE
jgi:hypothetical protein